MNTCDFPKSEHLKPKTFGEAETEPIGTTSNHPFWSVDRQEFVQAGSLEIGERLQTLSGDVKVVQQKLPRPDPQPVFNLEVHNEHVYFVGKDGVLVHNSCDDIMLDTGAMRNFVAEGSNMRHIQKQLVGSKRMVATQSAVDEFRAAMAKTTNSIHEQLRANRLLRRISVIPDNPSPIYSLS